MINGVFFLEKKKKKKERENRHLPFCIFVLTGFRKFKSMNKCMYIKAFFLKLLLSNVGWFSTLEENTLINLSAQA